MGSETLHTEPTDVYMASDVYRRPLSKVLAKRQRWRNNIDVQGTGEKDLMGLVTEFPLHQS